MTGFSFVRTICLSVHKHTDKTNIEAGNIGLIPMSLPPYMI